MIFLYTLGFFILILCALAAYSALTASKVAKKYPPSGAWAAGNGTQMHFVDTGAPGDERPAIVFLHGASGNLHDQMAAFGDRFDETVRLIFVDRPGHGWSARGPASNNTPAGQAETLAALLDQRGVKRATIAGHSFGTAIATSFALLYPDRTAGLLLMSPVSHPWPGGVNWYYDLAAKPVFGRLFSWTVAVPATQRRMRSGTACVFAPNKPPQDYAAAARTRLLLRPRNFRWNSIDVSMLYEHVTQINDRYGEITAPVTIITGNKDTVVLPAIHSEGLKRDIAHAKLFWIDNLGHKTDHIATDLAVAALENIAKGGSHDLEDIARAIERKIAADRFGPLERCLDNEILRDAVKGAGEYAPQTSNAGQAVRADIGDAQHVGGARRA